MNRMALILSVAALAVLITAAAHSASDYEMPLSGAARATLVEGDVRLVGGSRDVVLPQGGEVRAPSTVKVGKGGRLELTLPEGSAVRFDSDTEFTLVQAAASRTNRQVQVDVAMGDCWASVQDILGEDAGGEFEVNSPTAVAGVAGTVYRLHVDASQNARYLVYDGKIKVQRRWRPEGYEASGPVHEVDGPEVVPGPREVSPQEWMRIVSSGYEFNIRADGRYDAPEPFNLRQDAQNPWVQWNMARDRLLGLQ
ncbi:MAG: FecR family protein [Desulfovibrionaceae bacterium]